MNMTTKSSLWILSVVVLLCVFALNSRQPSNPAIKVAVHHWIGYESLALSEQEHLLDPTLVTLVHSTSLSESAALLRQNKVDAAALTFDEVFQLRQEGIPLTVVLIFDVSAGADILLTRPEINSLKQLKGKTIGMEQSALSQLLLSAILDKAELTPLDIDLRYGIVANHGQLWQQPAIDALLTYLPLAKGIDQDATCLFDSRQIPNTIRDVLAVRSDRCESFRPALQHLLECHFNILTKLTQNDPDTLHRIAPLLGFSVQQTAEVLRKVKFPSLECNIGFLTPNTKKSRQALDTLISTMQQAELLPQHVNCERLIDSSFLPGPQE